MANETQRLRIRKVRTTQRTRHREREDVQELQGAKRVSRTTSCGRHGRRNLTRNSSLTRRERKGKPRRMPRTTIKTNDPNAILLYPGCPVVGFYNRVSPVLVAIPVTFNITYFD